MVDIERWVGGRHGEVGGWVVDMRRWVGGRYEEVGGW